MKELYLKDVMTYIFSEHSHQHLTLVYIARKHNHNAFALNCHTSAGILYEMEVKDISET